MNRQRENRIWKEGSGFADRQQPTNNDRRSNLHTVFVNNLSRRVSRSALWEAFSTYGRVTDVFINFRSRKPFTFAFVRYRLEEECKSTIKEGNNRRVDGIFILVKRATFGWKERRASKSSVTKVISSALNPPVRLDWKERDNRTYRKVLLEPTEKAEEGPSDQAQVMNPSPAISKADEFPEEVVLNIEIPDNELDWLNCCAFATVKGRFGLSSIKGFLHEYEFSCKVSPLGGISVCFIFKTTAERDSFMEKINSLDVVVFDELRIPSLVNVSVNGSKHKIIVSTEEGVEKDLEDDQMAHDEVPEDGSDSQNDDSSLIMACKSNSQPENGSSLNDKAALCFVSDSWSSDEFSLNLSETELRGDCWRRNSHSPSILSQTVERNVNSSTINSCSGVCDEVDHLDSNCWALQVYNDPAGKLSTNHGLDLAYSNGTHYQLEPNLELSNKPDNRNLFSNSYLSFFKLTYHKSKRTRDKIVRKDLSKILWDSGDQDDGVSDGSITDEDIGPRNQVICRETEAIMDISSRLGLFYANNKDCMVDFFSTMEGNDKRGKERPGRREKQRVLRNLIKKGKFYLIFIQETKLNTSNSRLSRWLWGGANYEEEFVDAVGSSGGLLSCWDDSVFEVERKITSGRFILLIGRWKPLNIRCRFGNVYAPNDDFERLCLWEELNAILNVNTDVSWCSEGDFNVVRTIEEKVGAGYNLSPMEQFSDFIENVG
ncbi:hypothetical protein DITRI_Ditri05aG0055200 [Diplodiscus trichospermus]